MNQIMTVLMNHKTEEILVNKEMVIKLNLMFWTACEMLTIKDKRRSKQKTIELIEDFVTVEYASLSDTQKNEMSLEIIRLMS